jgi:hypothetical protein
MAQKDTQLKVYFPLKQRDLERRILEIFLLPDMTHGHMTEKKELGVRKCGALCYLILNLCRSNNPSVLHIKPCASFKDAIKLI